MSLRVLSISGNQPLDTATSTGTPDVGGDRCCWPSRTRGHAGSQRHGIAKAKAYGLYKGRVPTARRQTDEIMRLKSQGVRPSEIAVRLGMGRASPIGCWVNVTEVMRLRE